MQTFVRAVLKKSTKNISHVTLQQLWCSLDINSDNQLHKDEMASFFERGSEAIITLQASKRGWFSSFVRGTRKVAPEEKYTYRQPRRGNRRR